MTTFVVLRKNSDHSFGEPIYAGSDKQFALNFLQGSFVVYEFNQIGQFVTNYEPNTN